MREIENKLIHELKKRKQKKESLYKLLGLKGQMQEDKFLEALKKLEKEGKVYLDEDGFYQDFNPAILNKMQGTINISKSGDAVVFIPSNDLTKKIRVPNEFLNGAMDKDIVVLTDLKKGKGSYFSAKVEKIIERTVGKAVFECTEDGKLTSYSTHSKIVALCPEKQLKQIVAGHRVLVNLGSEVVANFEGSPAFSGTVEQIIGHKDDPQIDVKSIAAGHGFFTEFPKEVEEELKYIKNEVTEDEIEDRLDLRDETIFTIDGKDTKDMDDAVSIKKDEDGNYILKVHIADVSHYVKKDTHLYEEAKKRGTSAYLSSSVIPMLPHQLSNGICSLNEKVDRLTKTVTMIYDKDGNLLDYDIQDSVIKSSKKMNYTDVNTILEEGKMVEGYEPFKEDLLLMKELSDILNKKRKNRGNIDFCSNEIKTKTDNEGKPLSFVKCSQKTAEKIIENFMIAANETVTCHYAYMDVPFVYRVHGAPNDDKLIKSLKDLREEGVCDPSLIDRLLNKLSNTNCTSKDIDAFLNSFKGTEQYSIISSVLLKSMSKAIYSHINEGHFGLALTHYTHFTSPIRRFPDLTVHHLIEEYKTFENIDKIEHALPETCAHSSFMEREADKAEKETLELKMAEFMKDKVGEKFEGIVTNVTPYGLNIKLENNVRAIANREDIISANKTERKKPKPVFKLGSKVYTLVKEVSIPHRVVYLTISDEPIEIETKKPKGKTKKLKKDYRKS